MTEGDVAQQSAKFSGPPRLKLKKRDPAEAARLEAERRASMKSNPFGEAKPREAVIAERTGRDEKDVLVEDASKYDIHVRLTPEQYQQKKLRLEEINELRSAIRDAEVDEAEKLKGELEEKQSDLQSLMKEFEDALVLAAKTGEGVKHVDRRRYEREEGGEDFGAGFGSGGADAGGFGSRRQYNHDHDRSAARGGSDYDQPRRGNRGEFKPGFYQDRAAGYGDQERPEGSRAFSSYSRRNDREGGGFGSGGGSGGAGFGGGGFTDRRGGGGGGGGDRSNMDRAGSGFSNYQDHGPARGGPRGGDRRGGGGGGYDSGNYASQYPMGAADAGADYHSPFGDS